MIDFRTITTISKNFNYEDTIEENQMLQHNNQVLLIAGLLVGIVLFGSAIYVLNEEHNNTFYCIKSQEKK
jgi:hypothetical protein